MPFCTCTPAWGCMPYRTVLCFAALTSLPRVDTTLCTGCCRACFNLTGLDLLQINKVADAEQQWVYLEASSERGMHLYLRNGFQIVKETKLQPDAPTIYCMGRPPKPDVPSDVWQDLIGLLFVSQAVSLGWILVRCYLYKPSYKQMSHSACVEPLLHSYHVYKPDIWSDMLVCNQFWCLYALGR